MELSRSTSPHYDQWVKTHDADLRAAQEYLRERNFDALGALAQHNCLKMHAVAMTSDPPLIYWSGATLECLHTVQRLRDGGVPVFYTIDAGPQLKAVCLPNSAEEVKASLASTPGVVEVITSKLGEGAHAL